MVTRIAGFALCLALAPMASAEMIGSYKSKDNCTLTIEALNEDRGYTDGIYKFRSDGTGACEWTGMGIAKKTYIDGGIASGATRGFVEMHWVFGPAGGQVDVTFFEPDGSVRLKDSYTRN
ncbi:hypothetical protein F6455_02190 [Proteobacteria bacterium 005FR1]|nr:hypothetical protein [Proteobacteria bacterium 005FR1]